LIFRGHGAAVSVIYDLNVGLVAQRKEFRRKCKGLVMIQAQMKGFVTKLRYKRDRVFRREYAARKIQARFRSFIARKKFLSKKYTT
jgi:IQ calmodulin-binding motif